MRCNTASLIKAEIPIATIKAYTYSYVRRPLSEFFLIRGIKKTPTNEQILTKQIIRKPYPYAKKEDKIANNRYFHYLEL